MHDGFADRADFAVVYIAEAHPEDEWNAPNNREGGVLLLQHRSFAERCAAATACAAALGLRIPTLVDGMDNGASNAFAAWPERIYILQDRRIAYRGGRGPFDFDPADAREALIGVLATGG